MPIALDTFLSSLYLFSAPFLRMSAMMLVAPVFSAPGLSVRTRVLLATLVAALVAPSLPASNLPDMFSATGLLAGDRPGGQGRPAVSVSSVLGSWGLHNPQTPPGQHPGLREQVILASHWSIF